MFLDMDVKRVVLTGSFCSATGSTSAVRVSFCPGRSQDGSGFCSFACGDGAPRNDLHRHQKPLHHRRSVALPVVPCGRAAHLRVLGATEHNPSRRCDVHSAGIGWGQSGSCRI